ncbi:MAG: hypothetical protein N2712_04925 [Brevinematales bacterium]|nr:hypothetical protein [Brevinematales bacterium]
MENLKFQLTLDIRYSKKRTRSKTITLYYIILGLPPCKDNRKVFDKVGIKEVFM